MARAPYKLPNVFVGCPYGGKFKFQTFKSTLDKLPFRFVYADTTLETKQLLEILRRNITAADFCMFDVSMWNANVALELGLADGLGTEYYILVNRKLSKGVPADIQGIQRIEYESFDDFDQQKGLLPKLVKYLVQDITHPRNIWRALEASTNRHKHYYLALRILAHFRDSKRLTDHQLVALTKGTHLRQSDRTFVLETLDELGLVANVGSKAGIQLKKNLYR